ncbi:MAG: hypothetical protein V4646_13210 [Pseudomonadota bacterium]
MTSEKECATFTPSEEGRRLHKEYLADLEKRELSATESFDKSVLTLSSAGLGLSLSFLKDFVGSEVLWPWALYGSWIMFTLATVSTMLSFQSSGKAHQHQKEIAKRAYLDGDDAAFDELNVWNRCTIWINRAAATFFFLALLLTSSFVIRNLEEKRMTDRKPAPIANLEQRGAPVPAMQRPTPSPAPAQPASAPLSPASSTNSGS